MHRSPSVRIVRRPGVREPLRARVLIVIASACALVAGCAGPSNPTPTALVLTPVASGFESPLGLAHAGDGSGRLFVVERRGRVRAVVEGAVQSDPYLDVSAVLGAPSGENGLLGLAFHPAFADTGRVFVHYVDGARGNVLAELRADPPSAATVDAATLEVLLRVEAPTAFHLGGHIAFGPDGYLYMALGDGGVWASAQDLASPYGGLLRLDVDGATVPSVPADNPFVGVAGARPETWVYGLRNPWRFSFDAATGDLWIADVGEDAVEEVNVLPAGSPGGANYGWPIMEGDRCLPGTQCDPTGLTLPDFVYTHASGWGSSVTGGAVYRGSAIPELYGSYVFGDFVSGRLFVVPSGAGGTAPAPLLQTPYRIASFGEDEALEIHLVDFAGGVLYRLAPAGP